ncbi:MAG: glycosyltransferase 87 family protein [Chloroflexota bacterium]
MAAIPGARLFPLWLWVAAAPVVAITAVDLIRGGRLNIVIAGLILIAGLVVVIVLSGLRAGRLLAVLGLPGGAALPGLAAIVIAGVVGMVLAIVEGFRPSGRAVLLGTAVGSMVFVDVGLILLGIDRNNALLDLRIYLAAGERFVTGLPAYQFTPLQAVPSEVAEYPFLYPPPFLPIAAALSQLPLMVVGSASIVASTVACVAALRLVGVRWLWVPILLLWPPFIEAIWVGNVVVYGLLILAIAVWRPRRAGVLVAGPLFKPQFAIPALWLVRGRRWRPLFEGLLVVGIVVLVTLPLLGIAAWVDWIRGLLAWQTSVQTMPILNSFALARDLPYGAFLVLAGAAVVWGLLPRGLAGLRRLGVASVVASPSLYRHGLLEMIPAMVVLDFDVLLVVVGSTVSRLGFWAGVLIVIVAFSLAPERIADEPLPSV